MKFETKRNVVVAATGLSMIGLLAGCSTAQPQASSTPVATQSSAATSAPSSSASPTQAADAASTTSYVDGTYSETGSYSSPGGEEEVTVSITLAADVVTDVQVTGSAGTSDARRYQSEFESGIAAEVVGKNLDELQVSRVAGSSLTSGGFNDAVEKIRNDAAA